MKLIIITILFFVLFVVVIPSINANENVTGDDHQEAVDRAVESMPKTSVKCGECPCVNPCSQQLPPPSPPPPPKIMQYYCPPPPPRFYYFSGPQEEQAQATVPPPPRFTYVIGGPPGSLYPTDDPFDLEIYNGAISSFRCAAVSGLLLLVMCGLLQILVFYGL